VVAQAAAQQHLPALAREAGCAWASFLVPVIGSNVRLLLEAHDAMPAASPFGPVSRVFAGARIDREVRIHR
jgi:hypothetical protein